MIAENFIECMAELEEKKWRVLLENPSAFGSHITTERLEELAISGGLGEISEEELIHLVRCPQCFFLWCCFLENMEEEDAVPSSAFRIFSEGFLEAASAPSSWEVPPTIVSENGKALLRIFQKIEKPQEAMVVLELSPEESKRLKGKRIVVLDAEGKVLLSGKLSSHGRIVSYLDDLNPKRLRHWKVLVEE